MSSICGIYRRSGGAAQPDDGRTMMAELTRYAADAAATWQEGPVFLGCRAQHVTPESVLEKLPYKDERAGLAITADAIIDNRAELFSLLAVDGGERQSMPDSELIVRAYRKWGQECPRYLVGDFAFAVWDEGRRELFCAVDPTGSRTLYYLHSPGFFAFSTLIKPLLTLPGPGNKYEETWIADFLAIPSLLHQIHAELTPYDGVKLLPGGHSLTVGPSGIDKRVYWKVTRQPELRLKSDGEYEEALRETFGEAVRCRMRGSRPAGVMMSGGLDSTTVAVTMARHLAESGARLPAFSAVPMAGFRNRLPSSLAPDETSYIEAVREHAGNIDVTYCRFEGQDPLTNTAEWSKILEQPYKIIDNLYWYAGIIATAKQSGLGCLLTGGLGNFTISWGFTEPYLLSLFRSGRWDKIIPEAWANIRHNRRPRREIAKLLGTLLPAAVQKCFYRQAAAAHEEWLYAMSPINPAFAEETGVRRRLKQHGLVDSFINRLDSFEFREQVLRPYVFSHQGVIATKLSLALNIAVRDPTMDKRLIEFCFSLPEDQWVRNGVSRFLLRRAMKGLLPDKVRLEERVSGLQSADWVQRLQDRWPQVYAEMEKIGGTDAEKRYLDVARIHAELKRFATLTDEAAGDSGLKMLARSLVFSRFLRTGAL